MQSPGDSDPAASGPVRVLAVGDLPAGADDGVDALESDDADVTVDRVATASSALDRLDRDEVACVVAAASLPDADATGLLDDVRAAAPDAQFVAVSEASDPDLAAAVLARDSTDFVHWRDEPYQPRQLARRVENCVGRYRAARTGVRANGSFEAGAGPPEEPAADAPCVDGARTGDEDGRERTGDEEGREQTGDEEGSRKRTTDDRDRTEADGERGDDLLVTALDALPDVFFVLDAQGRLVRWNDRANEVTGYADDELAGRVPTDFFAGEAADRIAAAVGRVFAEGSARVEAPLVTDDGTEIPYEFTGALMTDDDGAPVGIAGIGRDVTERRRREAELEASREQYRKLVDTAPDAVFIVDGDTGVVVDTNEAAEELLGKSREEIVGMHQTELHPADETDRYRRLFEEHVEAGGVVRDDEEHYVVDADGREIPVEISAGITQIGGRTLNQAVFRDVTERRRREETLATLRSVTRDLMAAETRAEICDVAVTTARDILGLRVCGVHLLGEAAGALEPVAVTPEAEALFDEVPSFSAGEGLAWRVFESGEPELYDAVADREDVYNPETPVETEMILPLGAHGVLTAGSTASERLTEADFDLAKILAANTEAALDRADRERTIERQRDQLQAELDEVFERIDDGFVALDDEWRFVYANRQARRLLDAAGTDPVGDVVWDALPELRESGVSEAFRRAVDSQEPVSREEYVEAFEAWFEFHAYPSESGLSVYFRDISDRKRRETQLERQNERLESFASMLAHELRNPLSIAQIYVSNAADGDETAFEQVEDALDRMDDMIDILLVMTRGSEAAVDREPVDLAATATEVWRELATGDARLRVETDRVVEATGSHVQHLLENLFKNAVEHSSTSPDSDSRTHEESDPLTVRVGDLPSGFYVEDDGPGIPEAERERVFEAGYTTSTAGIGLGLTFISQLAEIYDWDVRLAESESGGARFEFRSVTVLE